MVESKIESKMLSDELLSPEEMILDQTLRHLFTKNIIKLVHSSKYADEIINSHVLLSTDELKRAQKTLHQHTPEKHGIEDNVFFLIKSDVTQRLQMIDDSYHRFVFKPTTLMQPGINGNEGFWATGSDWYYYDNNRIHLPMMFGDTKRTVKHDEKTMSKTIIYEYADGTKYEQIIDWRDDIYHASDIVKACSYLLILELRYVGGTYRTHILKQSDNPEVIRHAFDSLVWMEIKKIRKYDYEPDLIEITSPLLSETDKLQIVQMIKTNDLAGIEKKLDAGLSPDAELNIFNHSALVLAFKYGNQQLVELLINRGANVNKRDILRLTTLSYAARFARKDVLPSLLDHQYQGYGDALISSRTDIEGFIPQGLGLKGIQKLTQSISESKKEPFFELEEYIQLFKEVRSPLAAAVASNDLDVVNIFLEHGVPVTSNELTLACTQGNISIVTTLAAKANQLNITSSLIKGMKLGQLEPMVVLLKEWKDNLDEYFFKINEDLDLASILYLIENNYIKIDDVTKSNVIQNYLKLDNFNSDIFIRFLAQHWLPYVDENYNQDFAEYFLEIFFIEACAQGRIIVAKYLHEKFSFANETLIKGLKEACNKNQNIIVEWLLENDALKNKLNDISCNFNRERYSESSLLIICVNNLNIKLVKLLLDKGASTNKRTSKNNTPLAALIQGIPCKYISSYKLEWLKKDYIGASDNTVEDIIILIQ